MQELRSHPSRRLPVLHPLRCASRATLQQLRSRRASRLALLQSLRAVADGGARARGFADPGVDVESITASGTDPAAIGEQVVSAVKSGEFYIFTHPDMKRIFEARFGRILDAQSN